MRHQDDSPLVRLQLEHVIPRKHGGSDELENLALACIDCNLRKGSNLTGIDPETGAITRLFNPRIDLWAAHLRWQGIRIEAQSAIGRATLQVLDLNSDDRLEVRLYAIRPSNPDG
jgi:hypothetical protein